MLQQMELNRCNTGGPASWTKCNLHTERTTERKHSQRIQVTELVAGGRIAGALRDVLKSKYLRNIG